MREEREDARKREEKGKKKRLSGAMGKERDSSPIVHTVASPLLSFSPHSASSSPSWHTHTHTFLRNEPDYWLNPDRGITYSVKSSFSQEEPDGESMRGRDRDGGCVHAGLPHRNPLASVPSRTLRAPPLSLDMCLAKIPRGYVSVRECG